MIKYFGFDRTIGLSRFFGFSLSNGGGGNSSGGNTTTTIPYLSFLMIRASTDRDMRALPLTMNRINPNYIAEQTV